jgi:hypothetical protein
MSSLFAARHSANIQRDIVVLDYLRAHFELCEVKSSPGDGAVGAARKVIMLYLPKSHTA